MEKITINLLMDKDNNITISNDKINKNIIIQYTSKILNAQDVYDIFNFQKGNTYEIESNIKDIKDERIIEYYKDILGLFDDIRKELNDLTSSDENN